MRLWIVRHAIAMEREAYQLEFGAQASDDLRPLTAAGRRKMELQAIGLKKLLPQADILISSPLTRAEQTCSILKDVWQIDKAERCSALRPQSRPDSFVKWAKENLPSGKKQSVSQNTDVVIVGHGPGLPILIRYLICGEIRSEDGAGIELKKGGVCCLEFQAGIEAGKACLKMHLSPRILRAMAKKI